ncbi:hypothetical protein CJ030_MR4G022235 [Morella rubra]|uniref:Uncharacterized protein n=1 Tax=Morella rubra TaxID=262757 RepID=A0A6A1VVG4_9ROSI|nr:hypothetical protein CJ030_MR4G022235 [Morella rubra]
MAALNAKVFRSGETALHIAVAKGHVHIVEEVGGANVGGGFRIQDGSGMTAMARASALGGTPMLECMHKKNKNLHTVPDPTGRIPFLVALEAGNKEAARYFYSVTPKENLIGDANDELDSSLISALILENNLGLLHSQVEAGSNFGKNGSMPQLIGPFCLKGIPIDDEGLTDDEREDYSTDEGRTDDERQYY